LIYINIEIEKVILASQSKPRQRILLTLGINAELLPTDVDETFDGSLSPEEIVMNISQRKAKKAEEIIQPPPTTLIIAADTMVVYNNLVIGKPKDEADAFDTLTMLSGNEHEVYSGVTLILNNKIACDYGVTRVKFRDITQEEIKAYIKLGEPFTKAGSYGAESAAATFIQSIEGDFFNIVGLPVNKLAEMLKNIFNTTVFDIKKYI
jgi:septum formation protein